MTTRTYRQALAAVATMERNHTHFEPGMCKKMTSDAYLIPSDGTLDAASAWAETQHRFHGLWIPGAFIWWTGGSHGHGHVALMGYMVGHIRTVDLPFEGEWGRTTYETLNREWSLLKYAGCSLDINRVKVRNVPRYPRTWHRPL